MSTPWETQVGSMTRAKIVNSLTTRGQTVPPKPKQQTQEEYLKVLKQQLVTLGAPEKPTEKQKAEAAAARKREEEAASSAAAAARAAAEAEAARVRDLELERRRQGAAAAAVAREEAERQRVAAEAAAAAAADEAAAAADEAARAVQRRIDAFNAQFPPREQRQFFLEFARLLILSGRPNIGNILPRMTDYAIRYRQFTPRRESIARQQNLLVEIIDENMGRTLRLGVITGNIHDGLNEWELYFSRLFSEQEKASLQRILNPGADASITIQFAQSGGGSNMRYIKLCIENQEISHLSVLRYGDQYTFFSRIPAGVYASDINKLYWKNIHFTSMILPDRNYYLELQRERRGLSPSIRDLYFDGGRRRTRKHKSRRIPL